MTDPSKAERWKAAMAERDEAYRAWLKASLARDEADRARAEALQAWTEACRRAQLIEAEP